MLPSLRPSDATAAQLIMTVKQPDDSGAQTADRFEWQAAMAAADGLSLLHASLSGGSLSAEADTRRIVCEYHEDWVVVCDDQAELISCKHKDPSFGAYPTLNSLLTDGGLAHLFGRWCAMEQKATCRLVTTAGLHSSKPPQALEALAERLREQRLAGQVLTVEHPFNKVAGDFAKELLGHAEKFPVEWRECAATGVLTAELHAQVATFLSVLVLDHGRPARSVLSDAAPTRYARPVLVSMGLDTQCAEAAWELVLALFRTRMRAAGPRPEGGLPEVIPFPLGASTPGAAEMERKLRGRIVALADIKIAIETAVAAPGGYRPLPRWELLNRLGVKMAVGGCADNSIARADVLRRDYEELWRIRIAVDPAARADQDQIRRKLLRIADEATQAVARADAMWGVDLWRELQSRIDSALPDRWSELVDADLRLGGVCEQANHCHVWFSPSFDVKAEIERRRMKQGSAT
ncbi:hypothetical protein AB0M43_21485 [Longispora sp. NPDC051575]|uniref:hypothetical protein n=1 Tax=Longispora sp. NPDC051575 TaxID=3154943 RepID=UPI00341CB370